jgi:hypothetical protein
LPQSAVNSSTGTILHAPKARWAEVPSRFPFSGAVAGRHLR